MAQHIASGGDGGRSGSIAPRMVGLLLLAAAGGAFLAVVVLPVWLPGLRASLVEQEPKAYWFLSRSSGLVAYVALWLSMVLGLSMTNRLARVWPGGPTAFDLHQFTSLLGLAVALFHGLMLTGDHYIGYTLSQVVLPFTGTGYRPLAVGVGQCSFYLLLVVGMSFYVRPLIGQYLWRLLHFLSFTTFTLVLVHGLLSGTDSAQVWARGLYWFTGGSVLFFTFYRALLARRSLVCASRMEGAVLASGRNLPER